jgi:hypothetical protein
MGRLLIQNPKAGLLRLPKLRVFALKAGMRFPYIVGSGNKPDLL